VTRSERLPFSGTLIALLLVATTTGVYAQLQPAGSPLAAKALRHPSLFIPPESGPIATLSPAKASEARRALAALGIPEAGTRVDRRGGRFATLILSQPLLPGGGTANALTWPALGMAQPLEGELSQRAEQALRDFLAEHARELHLEVSELSSARVTQGDNGDLIQLHVPRTYRGIPVRNSYLTAVINHGNLILLGSKNWGAIEVPIESRVTAGDATERLASHLAPFEITDHWQRPQLLILPSAATRGYRYRLVWALHPRVGGTIGSWEGLVDAHTGEVLSFQDTNLYDSPRDVVGGVYPKSNDGSNPGGLEQAGYPVPFTDVQGNGRDVFTDSGGNLSVCIDGDITTSLQGEFAFLEDVCGAISESSATDIDLGTSAGTDCSVPAGGSAGNTHSARTLYYTLNRMREVGLGQLPGNPWLESRIPAISDFPAESFLGCNALWDGSGVLFTTSGLPGLVPPTGCSNTGELAAVIAHEWAHGLDDNDANGEISTPAEGIADVMAALWVDDSCIGRGFWQGTNCSADGADGLDACNSCDGVREINWRLRANNEPHDIEFIDTFCPLDLLGAGGPCQGSVHCEGHLVSEAAWDLAHYDLPGAPYNLDPNTAVELTARLFYVGSGLVGDWFQCSPGSGTGDGCNADSGYLNLLAVDDDNGNLADGTPHMSAIHTAFDRHGIACATPSVTDSGCAGAPTVAPTVSAEPLDSGARLTWEAVAGTAKYQVFRNEGTATCSDGKIKIGETSGLEFVDQGLLNGFSYNYMVIPVGASDTCMGPASGCTSVTPVFGANLGIDRSSTALVFLDGDADSVIDNCESAELAFDVHNLGGAALTNVVISGVEALSHEGSVTITTPIPSVVVADLQPCSVAQVSFTFFADGLSFGDRLDFRVRMTADQLNGLEREVVLSFGSSESDFQAFASKTFDFETDLEGWEVVSGTFDRTDATSGAEGTAFHLASSNNIPNQCDQIRSPLMRLQPTSTLSLWNSFDIEPAFGLEGLFFWFDRASVGVVDPLTGGRLSVAPDGGRQYNAEGLYGTCATADKPGWAGSAPTWAESTWSASALGSAAFAGEAVQIDLAYGTDDGDWDTLARTGIRFDQVTLSDIELLVADGQSDICSAPTCNADLICGPSENSCNCPIDCGAGNQLLEDVVIDAQMTWEACFSITTGEGLSILAGGDVTLDAPSIVIGDGLAVAAGGSFQAGDYPP
jgi:hypothetical protein